MTAAVASASVCPCLRHVVRRRGARLAQQAGRAEIAPLTSTNVQATTRVAVTRTAPMNRGRILVTAMRDTTGSMICVKVCVCVQSITHCIT